MYLYEKWLRSAMGSVGWFWQHPSTWQGAQDNKFSLHADYPIFLSWMLKTLSALWTSHLISNGGTTLTYYRLSSEFRWVLKFTIECGRQLTIKEREYAIWQQGRGNCSLILREERKLVNWLPKIYVARAHWNKLLCMLTTQSFCHKCQKRCLHFGLPTLSPLAVLP